MNSQWYSMQSHSINNSHSHTKVCRPRTMLEINLEQSVSKQSICSFLLEEQYHQIKVQALANLIWILHSRRTKCFKHPLCSQIPCSPVNVGQLQPLVQLVSHQYAMVCSCWHPCQLPLTHTAHSSPPKAPFPHSDSCKSLQKHDSHFTKPGHVQEQICHTFLPKQDSCRW